jgi:hypothetical protein
MAPPLESTEIELRFRVNSKQTLLVRELTPRSSSDSFVATSVGGQNKDQGILSTNSSAGIAVDDFYAGASVVRSVGAGANLYLKNTQNRRVVVVQLEDE